VLPIVQRELQVAARSRNFYAWRLRTGVALVFVSIGIILSTRGGLRPGAVGGVFQTLCFFALLFCLVEGIRKTSDAISEEKREGTLGFLFLTDLNGFDVILGKWVAAAVRSFNALLAFVPVLAISLLLGGTTGGEFWRMVLGLAASLAASLSLCILTSTLSREKSLAAAGTVLTAVCFAPLAAGLIPGTRAAPWLLSASPISLLSAASDAFYSRTPGAFWAGLGWLLTISCGAIIVASLLLPRTWRDKTRNFSASKQTPRRLSPAAVLTRRQMLDRNPAMWLMFEPRRQKWLQGFVSVVGIGAIGATIFFHLVLPKWNLNLPDELHLGIVGGAGAVIMLAAYLYVAREASRNLAEARQNGALELVLSTPLRVDQIIQGQLLALRRTLLPTLVVLGLIAGYLLTYAAFLNQGSALLLILKASTEAVLGIFTVSWFGMWMALTSKGATRAYLKTIALGILLPHLVCTPTIVNQLVLLVLAADKVKVHFRRYVAERYIGTHEVKLSPVSSPAQQAPPVLR
jgi:ABC-type transport system involved in multi-copper enzyme maturation permease subunit